MTDLFNHAVKFSADAKRNIVFVAEANQAFASLIDDHNDAHLALVSTQKARDSIAGKKQQSDFYYTCAIEYPFATKPYMQTRFSDGSFPVWYGSKDLETTLYETLHYWVKSLKNSNGLLDNQTIVRKRSIYNVFCDAILIDLSTKKASHPDLLNNDYQLTHQIGKQLYESGNPGLLSPSARHTNGINVNIFKQSVLRNPRLAQQLSYTILPKQNKITVTGLAQAREFMMSELE